MSLNLYVYWLVAACFFANGLIWAHTARIEKKTTGALPFAAVLSSVLGFFTSAITAAFLLLGWLE